MRKQWSYGRRRPNRRKSFAAEVLEGRQLLAAALAAEDVVVAEGAGGGPTAAVFNVRLHHGGAETVTVRYATTDASATAPTDYTAASGTLTFAPGETLKTVSVEVRPDFLMEANESFRLDLLDPVGATVVGPGARAFIIDDDAAYLSAEDVTVLEGDSGTVVAGFTVRRHGSTAATTTVSYETASRTATAGVDFNPASGTLVFAPGETEKHVGVTVLGDTGDDGTYEDFDLLLSGAVNGSVVGTGARGSILDEDVSYIRVDRAFHREGTGPTPTEVVFDVVRFGDLGGPSTVQYATFPGFGAGSPGDYTATSGTLNFAPGDTVRQVRVPYVSDAVPESNEDFILRLSNPVGATVPETDGRADIADDDANYVVIEDTAAYAAGDAESVPMTFTVRRVGSTAGVSVVRYSVGSFSVRELRFEPGETVKTISSQAFGVVGSVDVNLRDPINTTILRGTARGYVVADNASAVWLTGGGVVAEGTGPGDSFVEFTAHRLGSTVADAQVSYFVSDETATYEFDYGEPQGGFRFLPGETTHTVRVPIVRDVADEGDETFTLTLYLPNNVSLPAQGGYSARAIIVDDDGAPAPGPDRLYVRDVMVHEPDDGTAEATFRVDRVGLATGVVRVDYATGNYTGPGGAASAGVDYAPRSGTLTFAAGQRSATVSVPVNGDRDLEAVLEAFRFNLSNPVGATLAEGNGSAVGVIFGDDNVGVVVGNGTVVEGTGGTTHAVFNLRRVGRPGLLAGPTVVNYSVQPDTAAPGADYTAVTGQVTFGAGESEKTVSVPIVSDDARELNEAIRLAVTPDATASVLNIPSNNRSFIVDDDASWLVVDPFVVTEGNDPAGSTALFTVRRVGSTGARATATYDTQNVTAGAADFQPASGTLTFEPGETVKTIPIRVIGDTVREAPIEYFWLRLGNVVGAVTPDGTGVTGAAILDDDGASAVYAPSGVTVVEGAAGANSTATFVVRRFGDTAAATSAYVAAVSGSATAGQDFGDAIPSTLNFAPGEVSKTVEVPIFGDAAAEPHEYFTVRAYPPGNFGAAREARVTIIDDDASWLFVNDVVVVEGDAPGTAVALFTVTRAGSTAGPSTVRYETSNASASSPGDFAAVSGVLEFAAGETTRTVAVPVTSDATADARFEHFTLNLSAPTSATIVKGSGRATVVDDDPQPTPAVMGVFVSGSSWLGADGNPAVVTFKEYLAAQGLGSATLGYAVYDGAAQTVTLPWSNLNRVSITFSHDVVVRKEHLSVRGTNRPDYAFAAGAAGFGYDAATRTATWTFDSALTRDRIVLDLDGSSPNGVRTPGGDLLDGEWESGADAYPSGDGAAGGDFEFRLNVLPGDADRANSRVNANDIGFVRSRQNRTSSEIPPTGLAPYSPFADFDGTGRINANDVGTARARANDTLPAAPASAGGASRAPAGSITRFVFGVRPILW